MIRQTETLPGVFSPEGSLGGRLLSLWEAYGSSPFLPFYEDGNGGMAARFDNTLIVQPSPAAIEEWRAFCALLPDWTVAMAPQGFFGDASQPVSVWRSTVTRTGEPLREVPLWELYDFLQPIFGTLPPKDSWYTDCSYRLRHGKAKITGVCEHGTIVSTAMTVAQWNGGALIGCVATAPTHRRRGMAAQCVNDLTAALQAEGKAVYICPKNEAAARVYRRLGFSPYEVIEQTERK